jgi:hypothetical protein
MRWTRRHFAEGKVGSLTFRIHDTYFELARMRYDHSSLRWSMPIGRAKHGPFLEEIVVCGVTGVLVRDTEHIGIYDIHSMILDVDGQVLWLRCNVPLELGLYVEADFSVALLPG